MDREKPGQRRRVYGVKLGKKEAARFECAPGYFEWNHWDKPKALLPVVFDKRRAVVGVLLDADAGEPQPDERARESLQAFCDWVPTVMMRVAMPPLEQCKVHKLHLSKRELFFAHF